jgi:hypothetical protein
MVPLRLTLRQPAENINMLTAIFTSLVFFSATQGQSSVRVWTDQVLIPTADIAVDGEPTFISLGLN